MEASEEFPCLALVLKLEMPVVRELLSRDEIQVADAPPNSSAISTGDTTVDFLSAGCRLIDLLDPPEDIPFLSGIIQREIVYRVLRGPEGARFQAIATLGDRSRGTANPIAWIRANYSKPLQVEDLGGISALFYPQVQVSANRSCKMRYRLRLKIIAQIPQSNILEKMGRFRNRSQ